MDGVIVPAFRGIKTGYINKTVSYTAGSSGYDSITVPSDMNIDNFLSLYIHMSTISGISGLQITPIFVNGSGTLFYNYYAPNAVNTSVRFQYVYAST